MKKDNNTITIKDIKIKNDNITVLHKEIKKEAKGYKNSLINNLINKVDLSIDFKSTRLKDPTQETLGELSLLNSILFDALLDAQELVTKGTEYGVQLAFNRIHDIIRDRQMLQSPYLNETYRDFESNLWSIIKLRELAYGEIIRLKAKQDAITKSALMETDSMMRVRYFEDIRVLEKDILKLEAEAHKYDSYQAALHSEKVLKNILEDYAVPKSKQLSLQNFETVVQKYGGKK